MSSEKSIADFADQLGAVGLFEAHARFQSPYETVQPGNRLVGGCCASVPGSLKGAPNGTEKDATNRFSLLPVTANDSAFGECAAKGSGAA
jgi:hypothetical protein